MCLGACTEHENWRKRSPRELTHGIEAVDPDLQTHTLTLQNQTAISYKPSSPAHPLLPDKPTASFKLQAEVARANAYHAVDL